MDQLVFAVKMVVIAKDTILSRFIRFIHFVESVEEDVLPVLFQEEVRLQLWNCEIDLQRVKELPALFLLYFFQVSQQLMLQQLHAHYVFEKQLLELRNVD